jgi:uncharacterized protein
LVHRLALVPVRGSFAICRLGPDEPIPPRVASARFVAIARTDEELSIVCPEEAAPSGARIEPGWRCLRVEGPLPFHATGIMASLAAPLAAASIPIFAISTFDTDYVLVKQQDLAQAIEALRLAGHEVGEPG